MSRAYLRMRNMGARDWSYFWKRYLELPPELRAHVIVQLGTSQDNVLRGANWQASRHPRWIKWVNHTQECEQRRKRYFDTPFGARYSCNCPCAIHRSPIPIYGPCMRYKPREGEPTD